MEMDYLLYRYHPNSNKLHYVDDAVAAGNYTEDIDDQSTGNYTYDAIGNLIKDNAEGITNIVWNVYGKITQITKASGNIAYTYDAAGNRITKTAAGKTTLYVRDASGNVMSLYEIPVANTISQKEIYLYGSSRLGMALPESKAVSSIALASGFAPAKVRTLVRGEKIFELSNHLGNVLATITDKKIQVPKASPNQAQIDYYIADVVSATDYYAFGMQMPGRSYTAPNGGYRYGFNGKEKDKEMHSLTAYDYGFRIYNPALGKFLSVDPLTKGYPMLTPYQFANNSPIAGIDLDGLEFFYAADGSLLGQLGESGKIIVVNNKNITTSIKETIKNMGGVNSKEELDLALKHYFDPTKPYDYFTTASNEVKNKILQNIYSLNIENGEASKVTIGALGSNVFGSTNVDNKVITIDESKRSIDGQENIFDNQYNLVNTLFHENLHASKKYNEFGKVFEHVQIFIDQIQHSSFENTTQGFKNSLLNAAYDKEEKTGYLPAATSLTSGLASLVDKNPNRKSIFKTKAAENTFNFYYDIYKNAVEQYNKHTTVDKIPLLSKEKLQAPITINKTE